MNPSFAAMSQNLTSSASGKLHTILYGCKSVSPNVVFIHVGEEQILEARFGIQSIPVRVFFDESGQEVFRHTGFFAAEDVNKQLMSMGVK
jgi:thioredoxin-related protein